MRYWLARPLTAAAAAAAAARRCRVGLTAHSALPPRQVGHVEHMQPHRSHWTLGDFLLGSIAGQLTFMFFLAATLILGGALALHFTHGAEGVFDSDDFLQLTWFSWGILCGTLSLFVMHLLQLPSLLRLPPPMPSHCLQFSVFLLELCSAVCSVPLPWPAALAAI